MLMGDEHYVIVKFTSGEQVMAVLLEETEDNFRISYPMQIRMFPLVGENGQGKEHVTATPWNKFADDPELVINKRNVLFIKNLHHVLIPHYARLVAENEQTSLVNSKENRAEDLSWGDEEEDDEILTVEDVKKRIEMLESIAGKQRTTEEIEDERTFVEGNDTVH